MSEGKPLITLGIMCYNLEKVIEETLESAFAQTYSPLEIVVSDNASDDRSWEVIQRVVAEYRSKPVEDGMPKHTVIINRNARNLNIIGNLQKIADISHGEFIVKLDGDDIAYPNRIEVIVDDWCRNNREALMIAHSHVEFDGSLEYGGFKYGEGWDTWDERRRTGLLGDIPKSVTNGLYKRGHIGAVSAYHRKLFEAFPRFSFMGAMDDSLMQIRALMLGKIRTISEVLVKHRVGGFSMAKTITWRKRFCRTSHYVIDGDRQNLLDLEFVRPLMPKDMYDEMHKFLERKICVLDAHVRLAESDSLIERIGAFRKHHAYGLTKRDTVRAVILLLFPNVFGDWLLSKI